MGTYKMCMCITRKFMVTEAQPPPDVKEAFSKFSDAGKQMAAEQLLQFLVQFQGDTSATISDAERIIDRILQQRHHIAKFTRRSLTLDDFYHYLFSQDINAPIKSQVHQDMNAPLSHYFIYSSHNSYLTGNQLSSDSSDVPIIKALQRGVRGIELDMWPNSDKDDVLVLHGKTLTSPVTLIKCLRSIKEHAFSASPYPVILTLEDHLTPELQDKVAQMVTQIFGELLFYPDSEYLEEFPSPDTLKYKIILSTKPPKEYLKEKGHKKEENDLHKRKDSSDEETWGTDVAALTPEPQADDKSGSDENEDIQYNEEIDDPAHKSCQLETPEYRRLIAIHAGKPKGSLKDWLKVEQGKVRRLSLSEQAFENATTSHGTDLVRFTQKNILRIYPKTTRFDSSNYNPITGWLHGAQMVAFNMQGCGRLLWWMHGMFKSNGGCGFVKKPDFLMTVIPQDKVFDPKAVLPVKKMLKVKVYMGDGWRWDFKQEHFDTYSPPDFYTKVGIAGVPADVARHKTKITEDNWIPIWDEEFTFPLTVPELAVLRIEVHEYDMSEKDDFGGQTCLPVSELRSGIRAVSLYNSKGEKFNSVRLLMRFEFV